MKKISGYDLQKGRVSENKFDLIVENGRYFNDPIKTIVKRVYKELEPQGMVKKIKRTIMVFAAFGLVIGSIVVSYKWSPIAGIIMIGSGWLVYWFGTKSEKKETKQ